MVHVFESCRSDRKRNPAHLFQVFSKDRILLNVYIHTCEMALAAKGCHLSVKNCRSRQEPWLPGSPLAPCKCGSRDPRIMPSDMKAFADLGMLMPPRPWYCQVTSRFTPAARTHLEHYSSCQLRSVKGMTKAPGRIKARQAPEQAPHKDTTKETSSRSAPAVASTITDTRVKGAPVRRS